MQIELEKITDYADGVRVLSDGKSTAYAAGSDGFKEICAEWNGMIDGAHIMPAFGVSINRKTVKELNRGVWVEFSFPQSYESGGMPFERLLVAVKPDWYGFNIVRYTSECGYDGRCYYYDLVGKSMSSFYDCLLRNA